MCECDPLDGYLCWEHEMGFPVTTRNDWRAMMEHPCVCPPRPSTDECPRVEECYEAFCTYGSGSA